MTTSERPTESANLAQIAEPGIEYVVSDEVIIEHTVGRSTIGKLTLQPGDVVKVASNDPKRGLVFRCNRYPQGEVIVSPGSAARIQVALP